MSEGASIPVPIAQRLKLIVPAYNALRLSLSEIGEDDYRDALRSSDPVNLNKTVYPLERGWEVVNNYIIELATLGLEELHIAPLDGPRDLEAFSAAGIISARLADELATVHRARNDLTHDYPDIRAAAVYSACTKLEMVVPAFLRAYVKWLRSLGYAAPKI